MTLTGRDHLQFISEDGIVTTARVENGEVQLIKLPLKTYIEFTRFMKKKKKVTS